MSPEIKRALPSFIALAALVVALTLPAAKAHAQTASKLNVGDVRIQQSLAGGTRNLVILYKGRQFATLSAPVGPAGAHYCCQNDGTCKPIPTEPAFPPISQIVIACPGGSGLTCVPQP